MGLKCVALSTGSLDRAAVYLVFCSLFCVTAVCDWSYSSMERPAQLKLWGVWVCGRGCISDWALLISAATVAIFTTCCFPVRLKCLGATPNDGPVFVWHWPLNGRGGRTGYTLIFKDLDLVILLLDMFFVVIGLLFLDCDFSQTSMYLPGWMASWLMCWWTPVVMHGCWDCCAVTQHDRSFIPCHVSRLCKGPSSNVTKGPWGGTGLENIMGQERIGGRGFTFCIVYWYLVQFFNTL